MKKRGRWFAVKTLYRTRVVGRPSRRDRAYDADATIVEERVVIFRARSFDEAIEKAEREAHAYAKLPAYLNTYGQRIVTRYLGDCDAFELFESPASGREVYSRMELASRRRSDRAVTSSLLGTRRPAARARMFEPA